MQTVGEQYYGSHIATHGLQQHFYRAGVGQVPFMAAPQPWAPHETQNTSRLGPPTSPPHQTGTAVAQKPLERIGGTKFMAGLPSCPNPQTPESARRKRQRRSSRHRDSESD
ncbi:hypothetical protein KIN20_005627 [Parelaphostrongylus tenuis]|uniref:Uncharacterized protein n=1 Tax=Parelaphostrongylus tenuis TaxID=148309 RepID=A0AAD5QHN4_PARTN|nr:hypothetical protein KIN20_005627 [Parelaphostrongylus tenuis]